MRQSPATSYNILNNLTCNNSHILIYNIIDYILVEVSSLFFPYSKQAGQGSGRVCHFGDFITSPRMHELEHMPKFIFGDMALMIKSLPNGLCPPTVDEVINMIL